MKKPLNLILNCVVELEIEIILVLQLRLRSELNKVVHLEKSFVYPLQILCIPVKPLFLVELVLFTHSHKNYQTE